MYKYSHALSLSLGRHSVPRSFISTLSENAMQCECSLNLNKTQYAVGRQGHPPFPHHACLMCWPSKTNRESATGGFWRLIHASWILSWKPSCLVSITILALKIKKKKKGWPGNAFVSFIDALQSQWADSLSETPGWRRWRGKVRAVWTSVGFC